MSTQSRHTAGFTKQMQMKKLQTARAKWLKAQQRSDYAVAEAIRRYAIFADGKLHGETADYDQAMHVQRLLRSESKNVIVEVRTANQDNAR